MSAASLAATADATRSGLGLSATSVGAAIALGVAALAAIALLPAIQTLQAADSPVAVEAAAFALWQLAAPRVAAALVAGLALGIAGALMQCAVRNPLASPDLLGVGAGAQLGVLAAMAVPALGGAATPPLLFTCGLGAAGLAIGAAGGWRASPLRLILAGSACALLLSSIVTVALALAEQNISGVALWSSGALYQPGAEVLAGLLPWLLAPLLAIPFVLRPLAILALAEDPAAAIGVHVARTRIVAITAGVALTAVSVAIVGPVGFVGLIAPNLVRAAGVHRPAPLAVLSGLVGAALLLAADMAVRAAGLQSGLSLAVAVALIGAPVLLVLILRRRLLSPPERALTPAGAAAGSATPVVVATLAALIAAAALGAAWGETWLGAARILEALQGRDAVASLILDIRLPRLALAAIAGAMLAASGVLLQSVVRNALAGPELLGVTQAAALATLLGVMAWPLAGRPAAFGFALAGGLAALGLILALNRRNRYAPLPVTLTGVALAGLFSALTYTVIVENSAQPARALIWLVGGTYGRTWDDAAALTPWLAAAAPALALLARPLDLLALGDDAAEALGVPAATLRFAALALAAVLASAAVAIVGPVGFVGLLMPHLARQLGFHDHGSRLVVAMLLGALLLVVADVLGRALLAPQEIPAGAFTAVLGAPYFLLLLMRGRKARRP